MPEQLPLRDIHLPDPVSWWPPAPGWWLLACVALALLLLAGLLGWRRWRHRAAARNALRLLQELPDTDGDQWQALNALLKRVALHYADRPDLAALHGQAWIAYLEPEWPASSSHLLPRLADGPYRPDPGGQPPPALLAGAARWIRSRP